MEHLIVKFCAFFFTPPRAPIERLPIGSRLMNLSKTFSDFGELCYYTGVKDGLMAGVLGSLFLIVLAVVVALILRASKAKGGLLNVFLTLF